MKLILIIGVMLYMAIGLEARREREDPVERDGQRKDSGNGTFGGHYGRRRHLKQPFPMFPSCKEFNVAFAQKMKELRREKKVGPATCKEEDRMKCLVKDRDAIRCELPAEMSEECLQEINNFLQATMCDTTDV